VERVNARAKIFWGVDDGNLTGARRFHAYAGAVMAVCLAFATLLAAAPRREGALGKTRLGPIAQALRQVALDGAAPPLPAEGAAAADGPGAAAAAGAAQPDTS
jgi:hypothetical protein